MRLQLKTAIWSADKTQRRIAAETGISENRLSEIVCGWSTPTTEEKRLLADAVARTGDELFENSWRA